MVGGINLVQIVWHRHIWGCGGHVEPAQQNCQWFSKSLSHWLQIKLQGIGSPHLLQFHPVMKHTPCCSVISIPKLGRTFWYPIHHSIKNRKAAEGPLSWSETIPGKEGANSCHSQSSSWGPCGTCQAWSKSKAELSALEPGQDNHLLMEWLQQPTKISCIWGEPRHQETVVGSMVLKYIVIRSGNEPYMLEKSKLSARWRERENKNHGLSKSHPSVIFLPSDGN